MRFASMRALDISNGENVGVSLFVQGCDRHCFNCFNPETWDFNGAGHPSWVSRAHPSLPSRRIYYFIDSLKQTRDQTCVCFLPLIEKIVFTEPWRGSPLATGRNCCKKMAI